MDCERFIEVAGQTHVITIVWDGCQPVLQEGLSGGKGGVVGKMAHSECPRSVRGIFRLAKESPFPGMGCKEVREHSGVQDDPEAPPVLIMFMN